MMSYAIAHNTPEAENGNAGSREPEVLDKEVGGSLLR